MRAVIALLFALAAGPLHGATVAELFDAKFTDERGQCPRLHRVAVRADFARGCWTMGEYTRAITITWADGRIDHYSEFQFETYGRTYDASP